MKVGYYYTRFGSVRAWREVKDFVNVYMDWLPGFGFPRLVGKRLWITFAMNNKWSPEEEPEAIRAVVKALKSRWKKVALLQLGDELTWPASKLNTKAALVRQIVTEEGLSQRPVGYTVNDGILFGTANWKATGLDWLGLEAYLDEQPGETPAHAANRMTVYIARMLKRVGAAKDLMLIDQGFNRNGTWKDRRTLVAIQEPTFKAAKKLGARLLMLAIFAYVRGSESFPVGTKYIPELKAEHRRLRKVYP